MLEANMNVTTTALLNYKSNNGLLISYNVTARQSNIVIPNSITDIGIVFNNNKYLTSIKFDEPCNINKFSNSAFNYCSNMTNINIPNSITNIGNSCFMNCRSLNSIILPPDIKIINTYLFYRCYNLLNIILSNNITSINKFAFCYTKIYSIIIPASVTLLEASAFNECSLLKSIYFKNSNIKINGLFSSNLKINAYFTELPSGVSEGDNWNGLIAMIDPVVKQEIFSQEIPNTFGDNTTSSIKKCNNIIYFIIILILIVLIGAKLYIKF
jgi:hypothetical protein